MNPAAIAGDADVIIKGTDVAGAIFDPSERYRYLLWRIWGRTPGEVYADPDGKPGDLVLNDLPSRLCAWIMLNPSTADERVLDPTLRKCQEFSKRWGFDGMVIANIFALRSTNPRHLYGHIEGAIGDENNRFIMQATVGLGPHAQVYGVVTGWGSHGEYLLRGDAVHRMLKDAGVVLNRLGGQNQNGTPRHPLYLPYETALELW